MYNFATGVNFLGNFFLRVRFVLRIFSKNRKKISKIRSRKNLVPHGNLPPAHGAEHILGSRPGGFFKQEKGKKQTFSKNFLKYGGCLFIKFGWKRADI